MMLSWLLLCLISFQESDLLLPPTGEFAAQVKTEEPKDYFIVFVTTNCSPCERMKRDCIPVVKAKGFKIRTIDMGVERQWGVTAGPETWRCKNGVRLQRWVGYVSPDTLLLSVKPTAPQPKAAMPMEMGYREMIELHDRLHGGGRWTWPGDLKTHLIQVHGVKF